MHSLKGVIFDLDGTLIDSLDTYNLAFNRIVRRYRLSPIDIRELADFLNQFISLEELLERLYPTLSSDKIKTFRTEMKNEFIALAKDHITLQPHVKEVLELLKKRGMKIGVATGRMSTGNSKWRDLKNLRIDCLIDVVVTGGETKPKPHPDSLIKCAQELGLSLSECIFVGDSRADIIAGKSAGIRVIAVPTGVASREQLAEELPDYMLDSLDLLPGHIMDIHQD
ncbi:MAG: HAD family hydrolase [Thermodesulfobacteriota bacterium]|nr:HAD family hydrolase [Thermodesulfobacteriota bacterium]